MTLPSLRSTFQLKSLTRSLPHPLKFAFGYTVARHYSSTTLSPGLTCIGESGDKYELTRSLRTQLPNDQANIWVAVKDSDKKIEYVAKGPLFSKGGKNTATSAFMHEVEMQKLFKDDQMIRPMIDFIPSSEPGGPLMILEPFEQTLWDARITRLFTVAEIKWIMKGVLLGLYTVHMKGFVYTDLKMENVGMQGFDKDRPNENVRNLIVRLSDCGTISKPSQREVTPLTYRSPEIHFGKPWTQTCDIWSWGIILAQLFQARVNFKKPGMYDNINIGSQDEEEKAKAIRDALAIDFDLHSVPYYAQDEQVSKLLPQPQPDRAYMWANSLFESGIAAEDIQFLAMVLQPDPNKRLAADQILETGYLD